MKDREQRDHVEDDSIEEIKMMEYGIRWVEKNSDKYLAKWIYFYFRLHPEALQDRAAHILYDHAKAYALENQVVPISFEKRSLQEEMRLKEEALASEMALRESRGEMSFPCVPWLVNLLEKFI